MKNDEVLVEQIAKEMKGRVSEADLRKIAVALASFKKFLFAVGKCLFSANREDAQDWIDFESETRADSSYQYSRVLNKAFAYLVNIGVKEDNPFQCITSVRSDSVVRTAQPIADNVQAVLEFVSQKVKSTGGTIWIRRDVMLALVIEHGLIGNDLQSLIPIRRNGIAVGLYCKTRALKLNLSAETLQKVADYDQAIGAIGRHSNDEFFITHTVKKAPIRCTMFPIDIRRCCVAAGLSDEMLSSDFKNSKFIEGLVSDHLTLPAANENRIYLSTKIDRHVYSTVEIALLVEKHHPLSRIQAL